MRSRGAFGSWQKTLDLVLTVAPAVLGYPLAAAVQNSTPVELPHGPAKPGFDITRFSSAGNGWFETFYVTETKPLRMVLEERKVAADTWVLVTETAAGRLALLMDQMAFHHIAEDRAGGKDWMATF